MSDHVHTTECDRLGGPCHNRGHRCGIPHPTETADSRQVTCGRLDEHAGEHDAFGAGMRRVRWSA